MGLSISQVLAQKTIVKAVNQLNLPGTTLQRLFGWHFSGSNKLQQSGRNFAYDLVPSSRLTATGRARNDSLQPARAAACRSGQRHLSRSAETISLLDEDFAQPPGHRRTE